MVWDVFKGQITEAVKEKLKLLNIEQVPVPASMTHFFQPLDLTVNVSAKKFIRSCFTKYYSSAIKEKLDSGKPLDEIDFHLSVYKANTCKVAD